jgi:hypothetical protein
MIHAAKLVGPAQGQNAPPAGVGPGRLTSSSVHDCVAEK